MPKGPANDGKRREVAFSHERSGTFYLTLLERLAIRGVVRGDRARFGLAETWRIFFRGCFGCFSRSFFFHFFEGVSNTLLFDFWSFLALKMAPKCTPNRAKIGVKSESKNFLFLGPIFQRFFVVLGPIFMSKSSKNDVRGVIFYVFANSASRQF